MMLLKVTLLSIFLLGNTYAIDKNMVMGQLKSDVIRKTLIANGNKLKSCYENILTTSKTPFSFKSQMHFIISKDRTVKKANVTPVEDDENNNKVSACIVEVLKEISFLGLKVMESLKLVSL